MFATVFANPSASSSNNLQQEWSDYKSLYNKNYAAGGETKRQEAFLHNKEYVKKHNQKADQGLVNYRLAINQFSDLTHDEMRTRLPKTRTNLVANSVQTPTYSGDIPDSFDWTNYGVVGPVVDQGPVGSASLYAVIGAVEGQRTLAYKIPFASLSTQQIIDCDPLDGSVLTTDIYEDIINQGGIETAANYPPGDKGSCKFNSSSADLTKLTGFQVTEPGNEENLKSVLYSVGPQAVLIDASSPAFQLYSGGVYTDSNCSAYSLDHAMLIVGYGYDYVSGLNFWTLKNSWGSSWGIKGYMQLQRDVNLCGVSQYATTPLVANK